MDRSTQNWKRAQYLRDPDFVASPHKAAASSPATHAAVDIVLHLLSHTPSLTNTGCIEVPADHSQAGWNNTQLCTYTDTQPDSRTGPSSRKDPNAADTWTLDSDSKVYSNSS